MPLTEIQCKLLDKHGATLCAQMDFNAVLSYLEECRFLTQGQVHLLKLSPTGGAEMLSLLKHQSSSSFPALHSALNRCGHTHLADLLTPGVSQAVHSAPLISSSAAADQLAPMLAQQNLSVPTPNTGALKSFPENQDSDSDYEPENVPPQNIPVTVLEVKLCQNANLVGDPSVYPNYSRPKGLALIFNNTFEFDEDKDWRREGADVDEKLMRQLLTKLGYVVQVERDLAAKKMYAALNTFAKRPEHERSDSAVVVILSHGGRNIISGADKRGIRVDNFISKLDNSHCPLLITKPKLFFIQACRGAEHDVGLCLSDLESSSDVSSENLVLMDSNKTAGSTPVSEPGAKVPTPADMLIAHSSPDRYVSYRDKSDGSWFIQELCKTIAEYGHVKNIGQIMNMVNMQVSERVTEHGNCQIPELRSRLRKDFYFFPGVYR